MFEIMIILILSINLFFMKHPMMFNMILLFQIMLIAILTSFMNINFWYSYIMLLIMINGLMILFMYMTSIASNEKLKINMNIMNFNNFMMLIWFMKLTNLYLYNQMQNMNLFNMNLNISNKFFNYPSNMIMILMIFYILFMLIMTMKLANFKNGSLRQKF